MKKDILLSFLSQAIVTISALLTFKIVNDYYGNIGFSEYSVIKRNLAFLMPFIVTGFNIAIPRYISISVSRKDHFYPNYFSAAFLIYLFISLLFLMVYLFNLSFVTELSTVLFGKPQYEYLIYPLLFTLSNLYLQMIIYSYFRGKIEIGKASLLQIINLGISPILAIFASNSIVEIFWYYSLFIFIGCLPFLVLIFVKTIIKIKLKFTSILNATGILLKYGLQRVPGEIGISSLFTLPVLLATNKFGIEIGGYIAFSMSLVRMTGQIFIPIGIVLLPVSAKLINERNYLKMSSMGIKTLLAAGLTGIIIIYVYENFATEILNLYLSNPDIKLIEISKTVFYGSFGYIIYVGLRSIIDAYYTFSMNTISVALSVLFFYISYYFFHTDILISFVLSTIILVFCTLFFVRKIIFLRQDPKITN